MQRCFGLSSLAFVILLAGWIGGAAAQPETLTVSQPEIAIPANGAIVVESSEGQPLVQVTAAGSATTLGGTVRPITQPASDESVTRWWAWVPTFAPEPGSYAVTLMAGEALVTESITMVEPIDLEQMPTFAEPQLAWVEEIDLVDGVGQATCVFWDGEGLRPAWGLSFNSYKISALTMSLELDRSVSPELAHQFFYSPDDMTYEPGDWAWGSPRTISEQSDRYCWTLHALNVTTGQKYSVERCAPHGDLPPIGMQPIDVPDSELERSACPGPPAGFEQRWCVINRECDGLVEPGQLDAGSCSLYGAVCRNECLPGSVAIGSVVLPGGGGGAVVASPWGGAGNSGNAHTAPCTEVENDDVQPSPDASVVDDGTQNEGCGCSTIRTAHAERAALMTVTLLALLFRRRRSACAAGSQRLARVVR